MTTSTPPFEFNQEAVLAEAGTDLAAAGLPDGVHAIAPDDKLGAVPNNTMWYMSRWMQLPVGEYSIQAYSDDSATIWVGTNLTSSRMIVAGGMALSTGSFYSNGGLHRLSVILQQLGGGKCFTAFAIYREGKLFYVSRADDWALSDVPLADEDVPKSAALVARLRREMPVWTLMPNWGDGLTERLSFYTDVMESEIGAEQRRSVRRFPRRSLEVSMLRQGAARSRLDVFMSGVGRHKMLIPLFHEHVRMVDGITVDATGVAFPSNNGTADREFRKGDLVLVLNGDPDDYEIMEVGSVEPYRFSWAEAPRRPWPAGTRIYPLREARVIDAPTLENVTDGVGKMQIRFELEDPDTRAADWGVRDNGTPVFRLDVDRATPLQIGYDRKVYSLDNSSGRAAFTDLSNNSAATLQFGMTLLGRNQVHSFRKFIAAARGRSEMFYCPTFMADVIPIGQLGMGNTAKNMMDIAPMGMRQTMSRPQPTRVQLAIQFKDSHDRVYLNIKDVEEVFKETVVNLRVSVGVGGAKSDRSTIYNALNRPLVQSKANWTVVSIDEQGKPVNAVGFTLGESLVEHVTPVEPTVDPETEELIEQPPQIDIEDLGVTSLTAYLNGLRGDMPVVIMSDGAAQAAVDALGSAVGGVAFAQALQRCGAHEGALASTEGVTAYMLVGIAGIGKNRGVERFHFEEEGAIDYPLVIVNGGVQGVEDRPGKLIAERLHFYESVPAVEDMRTISRISFMSQSRFDQDSFEIHHVTSGSRAARSSVVVRQFYNLRTQGATA